MSIVTYKGHTNRARKWFAQDDIYFVIGGQDPWPDELVPPAETPDDTITDAIAYKKVESINYVRILEDGEAEDPTDIYYRGKYYRIIDPTEIDTYKCRWVMMSSWLNYDQAPVGVEYRKIGVVTGLVRKSGVSPSKWDLLPSEVQDPGILEVIANDVVTARSKNKREKIAILCEF